MDDYSYFLRKEAEITAIWQGLKLALRSMYKIQARTKPPTTSIAEKDCEITMAAKVKPGTMAGQRSVGSRSLKQVLFTSTRGERGREPSP